MASRVTVIVLLVSVVSFIDGCIISSPESLGKCLKNLLETGRDMIKRKYEPVHLKNMSQVNKSSVDWWINETRVNGLSGYEIHHLRIVDAKSSALRFEFNVTWPSLNLTARGQIRHCTHFFGKLTCFFLTGRPHIELIRPYARLETLLDLQFKNKKWTVIPRDTSIAVSLPDIEVEVRLDGLLGALDQFLGSPSKEYAKQLTTVWWEKKKHVVEDWLKAEIHSLIYEHVSPKLGALLLGVA
ncbi:uncharacterized protein LOC122385764 [Amphibalanus amphitrite]|uniref:uncharacterized protein LOC122385764 n=1 Tax=Amphibalanus amphitrite TaxID=1232801 RepID=UPI001C903D88|nr:uncharacterized protein LOC122385764 [Amphibalanus amphitrite]